MEKCLAIIYHTVCHMSLLKWRVAVTLLMEGEVATLQKPAQSSLAKCGVRGDSMMIWAARECSNSSLSIIILGTFCKGCQDDAGWEKKEIGELIIVNIIYSSSGTMTAGRKMPYVTADIMGGSSLVMSRQWPKSQHAAVLSQWSLVQFLLQPAWLFCYYWVA